MTTVFVLINRTTDECWVFDTPGLAHDMHVAQPANHRCSLISREVLTAKTGEGK
jgi:hypothetical protein